MGRLASLLILAAALAAATSCVSEPSPRATAPAAAATPAAASAPAQSASPSPVLLDALSAQAPALDRQILSLALDARQCALAHGDVAAGSRLAVIDYSLPSTQERLWVFDLRQLRLLFREYVAHGRNSGGNMTTSFSNRDGSLQSSLGVFRTAETYIGGNGYSLRMDGLEPGINDNARERLLVMHGADYVDPRQALRQGRLGRSFGCPALRQAVARDVIDVLKGGQLLFAYYPDDHWLTGSSFLHCEAVAGSPMNVGMNTDTGLHAAAH